MFDPLKSAHAAAFVQRRNCLRRMIFSLFFVSLGTSFASAQDARFALHDGDRVVFYGDSITEQRFYTWWTELYITTRFPDLKVQFFNAGVGGDRVTGGGGGDVDTRLARDVFSHDPTVITIMLGMNDGQYTPLTPAIEDTYRRGYQHILDSIHQHAPKARILLIGPSPYDETTRSLPMFPGGYNATMVRFSEIDKQLAALNNAKFVDANAPFIAMLSNAAAKDNFAAQLLVPDRVHPDLAAHLMIATAVLRAWNAPMLVSKTVIDSKSLAPLGSTGVTVTALSADDGGLSWTSDERALPLPLGGSHASVMFVDGAGGFSAEFDQEVLQVMSLPSGRYHLRIDESNIRDFTADELNRGANLALLSTPMLQQAQSAEWIMRDKGDLQATRTRILIAGSPPNANDALTLAETKMQEKIWQLCQPKPHHFVLSPAKP